MSLKGPALWSACLDTKDAAGIVAALRRWQLAIVDDRNETRTYQQALQVAAGLFAQPDNSKLSYRAATGLDAGYLPYGVSRDPGTGIANPLESWNVPIEALAAFPPDRQRDWRLLAALGSRMRDVTRTVAGHLDSLLAESRGVSNALSPRADKLQLLHYPDNIRGRLKGERLQSRHRDATLLTAMSFATAPGLHIKINGHWQELLLDPGQVVVITGQLLQHFVGDEFPGCEHTVEPPEGLDRTAAVYFGAASAELPVRSSSGSDAATFCDFYGDYHARVFGSSRNSRNAIDRNL